MEGVFFKDSYISHVQVHLPTASHYVRNTTCTWSAESRPPPMSVGLGIGMALEHAKSHLIHKCDLLSMETSA